MQINYERLLRPAESYKKLRMEVDYSKPICYNNYRNFGTLMTDGIVEHHTEDGLHFFNPGSVTIPKGGNPPTYMLYENRTFTAYDLTGNVIFKKSV